jgi:hypothetical protein
LLGCVHASKVVTARGAMVGLRPSRRCSTPAKKWLSRARQSHRSVFGWRRCLATAAIGVGVWQLLPASLCGDETAAAAIESGRGNSEAGAAGRSDSGGVGDVASRKAITPVAPDETPCEPAEQVPEDLLAGVDRSRGTYGVVVDGAGQPVAGVRLVAMTVVDDLAPASPIGQRPPASLVASAPWHCCRFESA